MEKRVWMQFTQSTDVRHTPSMIQSAQFEWRVLRYLSGTQDMGLVYRTKKTMYEGLPAELARVVETPTVVCSDISFAPRGETKSIQCLIGLCLGAPVYWKSSKQTVSALSTAEAELGGGADGLVLLKGLESLVDELLIGGEGLLPHGWSPKLALDNSAAVSLGAGTASANYRNRHLKLKATAITECIERGQLQLEWLTGEQQVADLGTKTLSFQVLRRLRSMTNQQPANEVLEGQSRQRQENVNRWSTSQGIKQLLKKLLTVAAPQLVKGKKFAVAVTDKNEVAIQKSLKEFFTAKDFMMLKFAAVVTAIICFMICLILAVRAFECQCQKRKSAQIVTARDKAEERVFWSAGGEVYHLETECRYLRDCEHIESVRICKACQKLRRQKTKSE